jgi:hypothetical protein
MFNRKPSTIVQNQFPPRATVDMQVVEKRAPTDESVRLLKEMEAEARKKIVEAVRLESNGFKAVIHREDSYESLCTRFYINYELNGRRFQAKANADDLGVKCADAIDIIRAALADDIARNILGSVKLTA